MKTNGRPQPGEPQALAHDGQPESAWRIAYGALDLARLVCGAPRAALFACEGKTLRLLALRGTECNLEPLEHAWSRTDTKLRRGRPYAHAHPPFVALPCVDGAIVAGVLLLEWDDAVAGEDEAAALAPLGRVLGAVLRRLGVAGGSTPSDTFRPPVARASLQTSALLLRAALEEHEWNVSSLARAFGVTRMTIYNRMKAARVARRRILKSPPRTRRTPAPRGPESPAEAGAGVEADTAPEATGDLVEATPAPKAARPSPDET